jgi:hypothetical protein
MGKKLNHEQVARYERHEDRQFTNQLASRRKPGPTYQRHERLKGGSRLAPGHRLGWALLGIAIVLVVAGCASGDSTSEQERRGGFYGGVSGGMGSHP